MPAEETFTAILTGGGTIGAGEPVVMQFPIDGSAPHELKRPIHGDGGLWMWQHFELIGNERFEVDRIAHYRSAGTSERTERVDELDP